MSNLCMCGLGLDYRTGSTVGEIYVSNLCMCGLSLEHLTRPHVRTIIILCIVPVDIL